MKPSLYLISAALFTWGIGEGMFLLFVPLRLEEFGANPLMIGSIFGIFGFMMMISHIPAGYLSDQIGRRPLLVAAWALGTVSAWTMALSHSLLPFTIGYLLYGVTAFVSSPLFSYVTAARGNLSPGRAMTLASASFNLGMVLGPVIGGWIGDKFGLDRTFLISAIVFIVSTLLIFFLKPQPRDVYKEEDGEQERLLKNKRFVTFLGIAFISTFVMFLHQPLTPNFLQNERGVTFTQIGWIGSVGGLGNVFFNLVLGHFNPRLAFLLGQGAVGLSALAFWLGNLPAWYALGYFVMGGFRVARQMVFAQVREVVHQARMGIAYGLTEAINSFASILAPLLAGYLYEIQPVIVYPVTAALVLLSIFISILFIPRGLKTASLALTPDQPPLE